MLDKIRNLFSKSKDDTLKDLNPTALEMKWLKRLQKDKNIREEELLELLLEIRNSDYSWFENDFNAGHSRIILDKNMGPYVYGAKAIPGMITGYLHCSPEKFKTMESLSLEFRQKIMDANSNV